MVNKLVFSSIEAEPVSTQTLDGRDFLVVPVVAVKEMVLNGELLLAPQIQESVKLWNDTPVSIVHPIVNGKKVSAKGIEFVEKIVVGRLYNAYFENKRLKGEMWIDIEKANTLGGDAKALITRFNDGEVVEVSTAYYASTDTETGTFDGDEYSGVQYNIRPDHLAILPSDVGACSLADGCGAPRVNKRGDLMPQLKVALQEGESYEMRNEALENAVREAVIPSGSTGWYVYLSDIYEGSVVYAITQPDQEVGYFEVSYTIDGDQAVVLGEAVEVKRAVKYVPVANELHKRVVSATLGVPDKSLRERKPAMKGQADTSILSKIKHLLGVTGMTKREEMVKTIRDNKIELTDEQAEATDEAVLQLIVDNMVTPPKVDSKGEAIVEGTEEKTNAEADPGALAINEYLKKEGTDLASIVSFMKAQEVNAGVTKKALVDGLVGNDACTLSTEVLEGMDVKGLTELTDNFTPGNFLGRGVVPGADVKDVPAAPAVILATNEAKEGE